MADYYPLIARAIDGLSDGSPAMRSSIYERARTALIEQLRSLDPPLAEADIERERVALDDAIARVEAERAPAPPPPSYSPPPPAYTPAAPAPAYAPPPPAPAYTPPPPAAPPPRFAPLPAEEPEPVSEDRFEEAYREPEFPPEPPYEPEPETAYEPEPAPDDPREPEPAYEAEPESYPSAAGPVRPRVESRAPKIRSEGRGRALLLGTVVLAVVGVIGYLAWIWRDKPDVEGTATPVAAATENSSDGAKFNERVGGGPPTPAPAAARGEVGAAQRAVLYEEDPTSPRTPKATPGRVTWRIDAVNAGQGQPLATVVRAQVEVPEAGFTMTLLIRRNVDNTLPASHTAEIAFSTKAGESGRAIRDVGLLQFKDDFSSRGTPVAGQRVTLGENLFVIGLLSTDVQRNEELMKRGWVDLPLLMASGQRAVLTFEKGGPGEQALTEAWRQWQ